MPNERRQQNVAVKLNHHIPTTPWESQTSSAAQTHTNHKIKRTTPRYIDDIDIRYNKQHCKFANNETVAVNPSARCDDGTRDQAARCAEPNFINTTSSLINSKKVWFSPSSRLLCSTTTCCNIDHNVVRPQEARFLCSISIDIQVHNDANIKG